MFPKNFSASRGFRVVSAAALAIALTVLGGKASSAQDKYTLRVPNGLAFSDFRGYENWQVVAVSQTDDLLKAEDRVYTVMSVVFYIGLGERFELDKLEAYPPVA
jgi:hypothetical protein